MARYRPYLLLALLALVWGAHWPLAKIGLRDLPPFTFGTFRVLTGLVLMTALSIARREICVPDRRDIPVILSVGLGQMAGGIILMNLALPLVAAGRSSLLVYTMPLWVAVIQVGILRTGAGRRVLAGLALGVAGIVLLLNPLAIDWGSSGQLLGSGALLVSAVLWAVTTIHIRHHVWYGRPIDLEPWQLLVALVPLALAAPIVDAGRAASWNPTSIGIVLYSGLLATGLAFWLSQSISRSLTPLAATMGFLAVPVVGLVSSWIILGEPLTLLDAAGAATTFGGILIVSLASSGGKREAESPVQAAPRIASTPVAGSASE